MTLLLLVGCAYKPPKNSLADMSNYKIESKQFMDMSMKESYDFLTKGTGYIYFGFDTCPWCLEMIPVLQDLVVNKYTVYYVNVRPEGEDIRKADNPDYQKVVSACKDFLESNPDGNPHIYVPQLFAVKNGEIVAAHLATVEGHDAPSRKMTAEEVEQLREILNDFLNSIN